MSISPVSGVVGGRLPTPITLSHAASFEPQLATALGRSKATGHAGASHRVQETGTLDSPDAAAPVRSMADDAKALVGNVFGALGADKLMTAATSQQAASAYARAS